MELGLGLVMISSDGGFLDRAVHPLDLSVGPGMIGFGQSMVDVVDGTGVFKGMGSKDFSLGDGQLDVRRGRTAIARGGEVGAVVSQDSVDLIGNGPDQLVEEVGGGTAGGFSNQPGKGELGSAVHGNKQVEFSLLRADLSQVNVEVTDGIGFELFTSGAWDIQIAAAD